MYGIPFRLVDEHELLLKSGYLQAFQ